MNLHRHLASVTLPIVLCCFGNTVTRCDANTTKPNVVLILADDLGWSDTTLFGTTKLYQTPHIERLAKRGMTFSRAYSASPLCSPTRASVLTGLSPARTGITTPNCHLPQIVLRATQGTRGSANQVSISPVSVSRLDTKYVTVVDVLSEHGYATAHFGKWHLGREPYSPIEHGFDIDVPHWPGPGPAGSFVAPWKFPDFDPHTPDEHIEDRMASEAVAFMEKNRDRPFFLNYWMFSVHAPFDAKRALIEKYKTKIDPENPQRSPIYAAMIESMDDAVGTLLDTLDRLDVADKTIIIFSSDNGGNMYNDVGGTTATSNAPLRGGKATMYEGGVRVPMVVCWPNKIDGNTRSDVLTNSCDFFPTILDALSIEKTPDPPFDGLSIMPALVSNGEGDQQLNERAIFTYFPHNPPVPQWMPPAVSVHRGDWKLIRIFYGGTAGNHRYKLFNLSSDIGETNNLADSNPAKVAELDGLIDEFLKRTHAVLPSRNPAFDPSKYDIEAEGKPASRHLGGKPGASPSTRKPSKSKPVAGWSANGNCELSLADDALVMQSHGQDPNLRFDFESPVEAGSFVMEVTMTSNAAGTAQLFWSELGVNPLFKAERSVTFEAQHDGEPHRYQIHFKSSKQVTAVRFDPAQGRGEISITKMQLHDASGNEIKSWRFSSPK